MMDCPPLRGVRQADAVIAGGSWTGLLTAYFLSRQGLRVIVLRAPSERALPPPWATLHQWGRLGRIAACHGTRAATAHVQQLRHALAVLPCLPATMREAEAYTFARTKEDVPRLLARLQALQRLGIAAEVAPDAGGCPLPVQLSIRGAGLLGDAAALRQGLCRGVARAGGCIHDARVMNATARQAFTEGGRVDAERVLLCTGKPLGLAGRLLGLLETRTALCCPLEAPVPLHTVQLASDDGLLLLPVTGGAMALGDAGRTGTRQAPARAAELLRLLQRQMPEWPATARTYRLFVRALDGLPVVGSFRGDGGRILCAAGAEDFLSSVLAALALTRLTLHQPQAGDLALRPDRPLPRRRMAQAQRRVRAVAALRAAAPRCSHCRCRLRWHAAARWWGCPCCGSAFGALGQRIAGPALFDASATRSQRPVR